MVEREWRWRRSYSMFLKEISPEEREKKQIKKHEAPSTNMQRTSKHQDPEQTLGRLAWIGIWSFSGCWMLVLGAFARVQSVSRAKVRPHHGQRIQLHAAQCSA